MTSSLKFIAKIFLYIYFFCFSANETISKGLSIFETISNKEELSEFTKYLKISGVDKILNKKLPWNWTVFAPNNDAFKALEKKNNSILSDEFFLKNIILDHILATSKSSNDLTNTAITEQTVSNKPIQLFKSDDIHVKDMIVITEDISANNGIIHSIGCVMYVQPSLEDSRLSLEQQKKFPITSCCMRSDKEINEWKLSIEAR